MRSLTVVLYFAVIVGCSVSTSGRVEPTTRTESTAGTFAETEIPSTPETRVPPDTEVRVAMEVLRAGDDANHSAQARLNVTEGFIRWVEENPSGQCVGLDRIAAHRQAEAYLRCAASVPGLQGHAVALRSRLRAIRERERELCAEQLRTQRLLGSRTDAPCASDLLQFQTPIERAVRLAGPAPDPALVDMFDEHAGIGISTGN